MVFDEIKEDPAPGGFPKMPNELEQTDYVNAHHVNARFVIPWTRGTGCGVALLMNHVPLEAEVMLSHDWNGDIEQTFQIIEELPKDRTVWFCLLRYIHWNFS